MIGDLFTRLQEAKLKIEEAKKSLNSIIIEVESGDGTIKVKANANKMITDIGISEDLLIAENKEELEDRLLITLNDALEHAAQRGEEEMKKITQDMLPNFPGLI
ncbi:MAG: YbaB/EbfC family nucleoid-associated protein [Bacteroidales bacterium]|nr:YbaB/EbfC family nucleoid-associated protein [Bacteroidales bacterium]